MTRALFLLLFPAVTPFYVPQTAWIRFLMRQHSQVLGDVWDESHTFREDVADATVRYPRYFSKPLHGFQQGGMCTRQALYQSPSMRYIMRLFQGDAFYRERVMRAALENHPILPGATASTVLDLGCGSGDSTAAVQDVYGDDTRVVGVDLSPHMVDLARVRHGYRSTFVHADAARLRWVPDASVHAITLFAVFHEMPRRHAHAILDECVRVLHPRTGRIFVWDQRVGPRDVQDCVGAPPIEPFLKSYASLNVTRRLTQRHGMRVVHAVDGYMQTWVAHRR